LQRVDVQFPSPQFRAIEAVDATGRIHAMTGFDGWTENSAGILIAIDTPAALRSLLTPTFEYVFNQCGKGLAIATVRGTNARSLKLTKHVGFTETHRIKDAVRIGEDLVLFEMRREECRYLPGYRKAA
jgi:hypothetical protein